MTAEARDEILARITPTENVADAKGADLHDRGRVRGSGPQGGRSTPRSCRCSPTDALLGSNTSSLPITDLADGRGPPGGLHRPALLLAGRQDAAAGDRRRRARPRTRPWPGRSTSPCRSARCRSWSTTAAASSPAASSAPWWPRLRRWSARACPANTVEQAALQSGYPSGPLALTDEVSLTLGRRIRRPRSRRRPRQEGVSFPSAPGLRGHRDDGRRARPRRPGGRRRLLRVRRRHARSACGAG